MELLNLLAFGEGYGSPGRVWIWNIRTQNPVMLDRPDSSAVFSVAFSVNGRQLACPTGRNPDPVVQIWDVDKKQLANTIVFGSQMPVIAQIAFSPRNETVLAVEGGIWEQGRLFVVDIETHLRRELTGGHTGLVTCVAFSPEGRLLASGDIYGVVQIWDLESDRPAHRVRAHTGWASGVSFSATGSTLATAGFDGAVKLWNVATGEELAALDARSRVTRIGFFQGGHALLAGRADGSIIVWDTAGREEVLLPE